MIAWLRERLTRVRHAWVRDNYAAVLYPAAKRALSRPWDDEDFDRFDELVDECTRTHLIHGRKAAMDYGTRAIALWGNAGEPR